MPEAADFQVLSTYLARWQAYDSAVKAELSATVVATGEQLVFVDPIRIAASALEALTRGRKSAAIVLTNANHIRAAEWFAKEFGAPVFAGSDAITEIAAPFEISPVEQLSLEGTTVIEIPGAGPGEIALHFSLNEGATVVIGDALINFQPHGFALLPAKYCTDVKLLRASLRRLLDFPFDRMLFAHGTPLMKSAHQRLESLLQA